MRANVDVQLDCDVYSLDVINSAAYRLIPEASCTIEKQPGVYFCRLTLKNSEGDAEAVRRQFMDFLTDESLRERVDKQTRQMRNLIVSLAFGALAAQQDN
jgi:His-Xaa-Ser system protein HxsD